MCWRFDFVRNWIHCRRKRRCDVYEQHQNFFCCEHYNLFVYCKHFFFTIFSYDFVWILFFTTEYYHKFHSIFHDVNSMLWLSRFTLLFCFATQTHIFLEFDLLFLTNFYNRRISIISTSFFIFVQQIATSKTFVRNDSIFQIFVQQIFFEAFHVDAFVNIQSVFETFVNTQSVLQAFVNIQSIFNALFTKMNVADSFFVKTFIIKKKNTAKKIFKQFIFKKSRARKTSIKKTSARKTSAKTSVQKFVAKIDLYF